MAKESKKKRMKLADNLGVKFRPKTLGDVVGQESVLSVVKGFFKNGQVVKTWLLAGPTGCGKSTMARIIARTVNCQDIQKGGVPCLKCESCKLSLGPSHPDIHEMNAGNERSIDDARQWVQMAHLSPRYNYRVFIIDEAHALTPHAINALLKPIEEPPPRTIWILCTTAPEKLKKEIIGRCLKLFLNYPVKEDLKKLLKKIAKKQYGEKVLKKIKPHLEDLIEGCGHQPRSSIQALEMLAASLSSGKSVSKKEINKTISDILVFTGELDSQVMKFLTYLYKAKMRVPLLVLADMEPSRFEEFVNLAHKYSYYAASYLLSKMAGEKMGYKGFWGVSKQRWEQSLDALSLKEPYIPLGVCSALSSALERTRIGGLAYEQSMVSLVYSCWTNIKSGKK